MTFKTLKDGMQKIFFRTSGRPGDDPLTRNLHIDTITIPSGSNSRQQSFSDNGALSTTPSTISNGSNYQASSSVRTIDTLDVVGRYFLMTTPEDSQCLCVKIAKSLDNHQDDLKKDPALKEFSITNKDDIVEEIMRHNEILDHI